LLEVSKNTNRNTGSENVLLKDSNFKEYEKTEISSVLRDVELRSFYHHSIKKYNENLKLLKPNFFNEANLETSLYDYVFVSDNFTKSKIDTRGDDHDVKNLYNVQVFVNATFVDLCVTLCGRNIEYVSDSKLINNNSIEIQSVKSETNSDNFKRFNFLIDQFISEGKLKGTFKLKLISHFNITEFNFDINPDDVDYNGLTYREESLSNISPDLLYIYGAFYIYVLKKLGDKLQGNLKEQCEDLTNLFGQLDEIWNIAGNKNMEREQ
jgi:hypothetical protein